MVDLPTGAVRWCPVPLDLKGRRGRRFLAIRPEQFRDARHLAFLSQRQLAALLHVDVRTVRNWETGRVRVPWAAYKLLRICGLYEPPHPDWAGWCLREGVLWTPDGRAFTPGDLYHLRWVFAAARLWHKGSAQRQAAKLLPFPAKPGFAFEAAPQGAVSSSHVPGPKSAVSEPRRRRGGVGL